MRWTERQRAMLREMGIVLWAPEPVPAVREPADVGSAAPAGTETRGDGARARDRTVAAPAPAPAPAQTPAVARGAEPSAAPARLPGLAEADWLVVGEPLDGGDPQQEQLLENMLRAIGAGLIAPSRERRAAFHAVAGGAGGTAERGGLEAALVRVRPRCVLAFGRVAAAALLGDDSPLGGVRGRVHVFAGVPVVVTFSLAFLLRHPLEKAKAWSDLCLAVGATGASTPSTAPSP